MEKDSNKDKIRFISQGSISELCTQIFIGIEISYIEKNIGLKWIDELEQIIKILSKLKKSLNNKGSNQ